MAYKLDFSLYGKNKPREDPELKKKKAASLLATASGSRDSMAPIAEAATPAAPIVTPTNVPADIAAGGGPLSPSGLGNYVGPPPDSDGPSWGSPGSEGELRRDLEPMPEGALIPMTPTGGEWGGEGGSANEGAGGGYWEEPDDPLAAPGDYVGPVRSDPMFDPEDMVGPGGASAVPGVEDTFFGRFGEANKTPEVEMYPQQKPAPVEMSDAWTYEQTWMDPFIKQNLMKRKPVELQSTMADIAAGKVSPAILQQRERAMQSALATAASARGVPTSATQRMMTQQMSEADRSAMEAAAQQQLQAGQAVDQMAQAKAQINAQVEQQRDSMLDSLIGRGVDRNVALAQVNAEMERLKLEMEQRYWAGRLGAGVEVVKTGVEHADFLEGGVESVAEVAPVLNMLFGAPTPEGFDLPTQRIISDYTNDPQGIFTQTTAVGQTGMDEMFWNHETQSWEMKQGAPGQVQDLGIQDFGGSLVRVLRWWNEDKQIYEYSFEPEDRVDEPGWGSAPAPTLPSSAEDLPPGTNPAGWGLPP